MQTVKRLRLSWATNGSVPLGAALWILRVAGRLNLFGWESEREKVCVCDLAVVVAKFRVLLSLGIDVVVLFLRDGVGKELFFRT